MPANSIEILRVLPRLIYHANHLVILNIKEILLIKQRNNSPVARDLIAGHVLIKQLQLVEARVLLQLPNVALVEEKLPAQITQLHYRLIKNSHPFHPAQNHIFRNFDPQRTQAHDQHRAQTLLRERVHSLKINTKTLQSRRSTSNKGPAPIGRPCSSASTARSR